MLKIVGGIMAGLLAWAVAATLVNLVLRAVLPGYTEVEKAMNFTLAMLLSRLLLGGIASFCAGFVTAWIAKRRVAAKILAGILLVVFLPVHYSLWDKFPAWYHAVFLISLVVVTMLGAMCYSRGKRSTTSELPAR